MRHLFRIALSLVPLAGAACADESVKVGVILSTTGPAASLGIPERDTIALLPRTIGGHAVDYIVLDDATDTSNAVRAMRRLVTEEKADVIIGSTVTPSTIAMTDVAAETQIPVITLAAASVLVEPVDAKRRWVFKTPQNDSMMAAAILDHMAAHDVRTVGFIGFSDALGESWLSEVTKLAAARHIALADVERYARTDTSVAAQVLKLMAAKPDAILVAGYGAPAALPEKTLREHRYGGAIYQTHGAGNADFLRIGGKDVDGTLLPLGPLSVASDLPDDSPIRKVALAYVGAYDAKYGTGSASAFGGYAYDAGLLLEAAVPGALNAAAPGTAAFRLALRDALETVKNLVTTTGVVSMSPTDHLGLDDRARVMAVIEDGRWKLAP